MEEVDGGTQVTAAVVQAAPFCSTPRTLEKLVDLTGDAARRGANLVVFPEAFVAGYPKGLDFGARLGIRLPEGREEFRRYFESAIDVPGPATEAIGAAAERRRRVPRRRRDRARRRHAVLHRLFFGPTAACSASTAS